MNALFKNVCIFSSFLVLSACGYYLEQPYYNPEPPIKVKVETKVQKNSDGTVTVNHTSWAEGGVYALPDTAESAANAGRILETGKGFAAKEGASSYEERGTHGRPGDIIGLQFNNLSGRDILSIEVKRRGQTIHRIVGMPTGKISEPVPVGIGERLSVRIHYIDHHRYGTRSKWIDREIVVGPPVIKIKKLGS
jgi:hypothetical protein